MGERESYSSRSSARASARGQTPKTSSAGARPSGRTRRLASRPLADAGLVLPDLASCRRGPSRAVGAARVEARHPRGRARRSGTGRGRRAGCAAASGSSSTFARNTPPSSNASISTKSRSRASRRRSESRRTTRRCVCIALVERSATSCLSFCGTDSSRACRDCACDDGPVVVDGLEPGARLSGSEASQHACLAPCAADKPSICLTMHRSFRKARVLLPLGGLDDRVSVLFRCASSPVAPRHGGDGAGAHGDLRRR